MAVGSCRADDEEREREEEGWVGGTHTHESHAEREREVREETAALCCVVGAHTHTCRRRQFPALRR